MTDALLQRTLSHLERLVAFDTRNPPRAIDGGGIFSYLRDHLPDGFLVTTQDLGEGCVWMLAVRGAPKLLVNVHVDTVPADPGWTRDPHRLLVEGSRAVGLGACDIKGAAAAILAALPSTKGDAALLFSSDEEAGSSRCIKDFVSRHRFDDVVACEPTRCRAVLAHRGIGTATATFSGRAGHASAARALQDSAVHEAVRWSHRALERAASSEQAAPGAAGLSGLCLNLGAIEGGVKANMIASTATVRFGVRPPPEEDPASVLEQMFALAPEPSRASFQRGFLAPPLPARGPQALAPARALAGRLGLDEGPPVDFWTEAALFSAAGSTAIVYGPGDIAQAHTADEYVEIDDLAAAAAFFARAFA